jgi:hypothetical protein
MPEPAAYSAHASVATDAAERYAKQLASHLGRKAEVREEPGGTRIVIGAGDCLLSSRPDHLDLVATAADQEGLDRVMDVVGRHLERFGQRHELRVDWTRA